MDGVSRDSRVQGFHMGTRRGDAGGQEGASVWAVVSPVR